MARIPNKLVTVEIKLSTTPQVAKYLDSLVETGLYGKNRSEAAERLVAKGIEALIKDSTLTYQSR
jgi:Arc/MetJ-type ribon-helix-helix transcriptional regulator